MTMKFETQMSWAAQWEQEQLNKLIEDTKVYLRNKMAIDEPEDQPKQKESYA